MIVPSAAQLGIIAVIAALIFGTGKLRKIGGDIGGMFKGVKDGFREAAGAAEELAPEIRSLKQDVQAIRESGRQVTGSAVSSYTPRRYIPGEIVDTDEEA